MRKNKNKEKNCAEVIPEISKEAAEAIERLRKHIDSLPVDHRPKVCISSIAYNQEAFITQTLDGFVMQQTDFPFIAIVHDDASTDGTADIIRQYAEKYPDIIFPIFEKENQYHKPGGPITFIMRYAEEATGAEYIAKCEGDDYWTSSQKLQMQVDFLDNHPDYVMCSHSCTWHDISNDSYIHHMEPIEREYDWNWLFENRPWPMQTLTVLYRSKAFVLEEFLKYEVRYDVILFWYLLHKGKGHKFKEDMAMYTIHNGGTWSGLSNFQKWDFDYRIAKTLFEVDPSNVTLDFFFSKTLRHWAVGRKFVLTKRFGKFCCLFNSGVRNVGWFLTLKKLFQYLLKG